MIWVSPKIEDALEFCRLHFKMIEMMTKRCEHTPIFKQTQTKGVTEYDTIHIIHSWMIWVCPTIIWAFRPLPYLDVQPTSYTHQNVYHL